MAGRSMLPTPTRSVRCVSSTVRTVVETTPSPSPPCPAAQSRLPRASGLRPPRTYASPAAGAPCARSASTPQAAPCARPYVAPRGSGLRPPQVRSGLRPPQASGLRPPRVICPGLREPSRVSERARSPSPQRARSPSPPPPCTPPPCEPPPAPVPCPAAASPRWEDMSPREILLATESEAEAAARAAARARWLESLAAFPDTMDDQLRRVAERRRAAQIEQEEARTSRTVEERLHKRRMEQIEREEQLREAEEQREEYNMTLEAIEEMLMEERDMMLREQQDRLLEQAAEQITSEAQWRAALGIVDEWRRNMLDAYQPYAAAEARLAADRQLIERRRRRYRRQMIPRRPPMSPLEEAQVTAFDESPPCTLPPPVTLSPSARAPTILDFHPPCGLPLPALQSYRAPEQQQPTRGDWCPDLGGARRQLLFDSDDDSDMLDGAVGGSYR